MKQIENLANQIVARAATDYRNALRGYSYIHKTPESIVRDCESFFKSEWFRILTNVDGEYLMRKLKEECINESIARSANSEPRKPHRYCGIDMLRQQS